MVEIGIVEIIGMGGALGIIGTMFIVLYFSRKQAQGFTVDIETKVLNDFDEKVRKMAEIIIEKLLDGEREKGTTKINPEECKEKARTLRALSEGIAYHLQVNPDPVNLEDKKFWFQIRSMMLFLLKKKIFT
jgi:hypothetical protein